MSQALRVTVLLLALLSSSCQEAVMDKSKAEIIVYQKLAVVLPDKGVDLSKLPPPTINQQGNNLIFDFVDYEQNAWVVVIVHSNGFAEISFDKASSP